MKKYTFIAFVQFFALNCLLFFVPVTAVHGQTASLMDEALSAGALSYAQAAYFVLTAADINYNAAGAGYTDNGYSSEKAAITAAFSYAASQGWLPKKVSPTVEGSGDKVIKLSELSFLMIKSFKLKGNILYRIFPGPHYAYKEMVYRGYITGTTDPSLPLNGEKFFEILGNLLSEVPEIERQTTELAADERAAAERQAAERADAEQQAAELAAAERQATAERLAAERADAERQAVERAAAELAAAERQAAAERLATERAEAERQAVERAAAELAAAERQAATERLAAERQAEAEHLAAEGAEAERQAVERAAAERLAAERADAERQAAERTAAELAAVERQAEAERLAAERADAERQAAERAAAELAAVERQAATERLAAERADAERQAAERAAVERQAAAERLAVERQAAAERQAADESQVTLTETITTISRVHIQFTADALILSETQKIKLQEVAQILSRYPDWPIQIAGHTAQAGSISGQQMISRDRAQIVADYLESLGCRRADEMTVIGYGATQPLADNSTAAGMALNRRVEITFAGQDAVQAAKTEAITTISRIRIQFTADASVLGNAEKTKLQEAAQILSRYPGRSIRLEGHTAMAGGEEGRQQISQDRAQAVADYLESLGCRRSDEMTVIGYGASQPLADNSTAAGMALNRRVEITILD